MASGGLVETAERAAMGARGGQDRLDPRAAYIIGDILADPQAKAWEFNAAEMRFPVPTAIKTGTSSNHRDAWAVGYDSRFVAGVWLGNLDFAETDGLTGANGALRLLRSVLAEAGRNREGAPLARPSGIVEAKVCLTPACDAQRLEKFAEGTEPAAPQASQAPPVMRMVSPVSGQKIAIDPRVPRARQRLPLEAGGLAPGDRAVWSVDGRPVEGSSWPVAEGSHTVRLLVMRGGKAVYRERATVSVLPAGRQRP
ncbi:hypothetical protein FACS1894186_7770 [Alphaproteobacteria bacterium]|nr:hypothetical protein FACS1894186_7770 [Alphaproteobacteria bacterium]